MLLHPSHLLPVAHKHAARHRSSQRCIPMNVAALNARRGLSERTGRGGSNGQSAVFGFAGLYAQHSCDMIIPRGSGGGTLDMSASNAAPAGLAHVPAGCLAWGGARRELSSQPERPHPCRDLIPERWQLLWEWHGSLGTQAQGSSTSRLPSSCVSVCSPSICARSLPPAAPAPPPPPSPPSPPQWTSMLRRRRSR